ncbi:hypothetical protein UY3_08487 [Chelonia mydas]|uniref:Uncharacterized protein n=1 Tax=Chelonia mydas TaxID=8469 RepID=M7BB39_CHEMY|nr:hypothetical protein UY3_08487 [Chelonia mydas]
MCNTNIVEQDSGREEELSRPFLRNRWRTGQMEARCEDSMGEASTSNTPLYFSCGEIQALSLQSCGSGTFHGNQIHYKQYNEILHQLCTCRSESIWVLPDIFTAYTIQLSDQRQPFVVTLLAFYD